MSTAKAKELTVHKVRDRVLWLESIKGDDEAAHAEEDEIRRDVLRAIAGGAPVPQLLAAEALKTEDIDFARWYA